MYPPHYPPVDPQSVVQQMNKTTEYKVDHNNVQYSNQEERATTSVQNPEVHFNIIHLRDLLIILTLSRNWFPRLKKSGSESYGNFGSLNLLPNQGNI